MNNITFPLEQRRKGPEVRDLQDALQVLLDRGVIVADEGERRELSEALQRERSDQTYGNATRKVVGKFQEAQRLDANGAVDEPTANAINKFLREWGFLDQQGAPRPSVVSGQVRREDGLPFSGGIVRAFHETGRGSIRLGQDTSDAEGGYTIRYERLPDVASVHLRVSVADDQGKFLKSSDLIRDARPLETVDLLVPAADKPPRERRIEGRVVFDNGAPAQGLPLRLYRLDFGDAEVRLIESTTRERGLYALPYDLDGHASLEIRAVDGAGKEIPLSKPLHDLGDAERTVLNLVAPATLRPMDVEYRRLVADLTPHVGAIAKLAAAREDAEHQDLTRLNRATNWDARVIALGAIAAKLSKTTGVDTQALYGMLRAGLPSDPIQLARVSRTGVGRALEKAVEAGLVALTPDEVESAKVSFADYSSRIRRRFLGRPGAHSNYGDVLAATGITTDQQERADQILAAHSGSIEQLWQRVQDAGLPVEKLKLTARLGFLTLDNATLMRDLSAEIGSPERLAETLINRKLYEPRSWETRLRSLTGNDDQALARLIPGSYEGETMQDRLKAYTVDLAQKVRRSYPTQIVSHRIRSNDLDLGASQPSVKGEVAEVLDRAATVGFSLGGTPLNRFLRDHSGDLFQGIPDERIPEVTAQVKTIQRLYQITRSDEGLKTLLELGFTSAHEISEMPYQVFMDRHGDKFPSRWEAELTYRRAQQVSVVTYTFLGAAKQIANPVPVPATSPPSVVAEEAKNQLIKQFPTLESLFGSLDYCECEHCRSVLSPAAYLVDILKFLDPALKLWTEDLEEWKKTHGNATYPFPTVAAWQQADSPTPKTPYDVLIERRPDLPELPLTCENTHTALPYIDIVNEILEYYLVHHKLGTDAAYDTGEATTADLLAEPQNLLPAAYDILKGARYPLTLPFDLWLETVRRFAAHFDTSLWQVLDVLRTTDDLYPAGGSGGYGRAAVAFERLGFSSREVDLLAAADPLAAWRGLYGYDPAQVSESLSLATLTAAKPLARRLGVSYRELVAIVRTSFVNPRLGTLATLRKLGIATEDLMRYMTEPGHAPFTPAERTAFEATVGPSGLAWLQKAWDDGEFERILVLADPVAGCGFDTTTLRYADGTAVDPIVFVLLNYFVRVWRRLGWSIEETDRALQVFLPRDPDPRTGATIGPAMTTALLGLARLDELTVLLKTGRKGRRDLLALWAPLDDRRYVELFLTGSEQTRDRVFEDPLGRYLSHLDAGQYQPFHFDPQQPENVAIGNVGLRDHLGAVQGALQLTAGEVAQILADAGLSLDSAPLNLATLSLLYRHGLLARLLRLSVADLFVLEALSGFNPFTPPHERPITGIAQDNPYRHTIRFVEVAAAVKDSKMSVAELDYLLRHRFDPVGAHRAAAQPPLALVRTLTSEIARIRAEHAEPADALTFTDEVVVRKLALVLEPDVVQTFLAMWTGEVGSDSDFFDEHLLRRVVPGVGEVGFLEANDPATLFTPTPEDQALESARRARLAAAFLPYLQDRLIRQLVFDSVATAAGAEPVLVEALLSTPALLDDPDRPGQALLAGYIEACRHGLTTTSTGSERGRVSGYVEVPATGAYRFFVRCEQAAVHVELHFDHLAEPLFVATTSDSDLEPSAHTELRAGVPYGFTLDHSGAGGVALHVQGQQLPKGEVDNLVTYPRAGVDRLHRLHLLVGKTLRLVDALTLAESELRHVLTHPADFSSIDLGRLPTRTADDNPVLARALFRQFLRMIGYIRLRKALAAEADDLVDVFAHARRRVPEGDDPAQVAADVLADVYGRLATITRREATTVRAAADLLGMSAVVVGDQVTAAGFIHERGVSRLWDLLVLATRLGVDPSALGRWADPRPSFEVARDVRDTVKARYEPEQWRRVAQPIFNTLRQRRRDALVAHIMHTDGFDRLEQLFEFFLIDPGMEPVVQTSRLRLAISSVQTFIQRCLLNLEPKVHPTALNAEHWQWMKRYRVWEANRKIFLWPENWLEPEFRDDKTHLCAELESALLESDLGNERAEAAFFDYLRGLETLARLDVRAVYVEPKSDPQSKVLHVVARTFGSPHKYFYRSYAGRMWTPWVPVTAEIEGDHVVLALWRDRVHLFWVTFLEKAEADKETNKGTSVAGLTAGQLAALKPNKAVDVRLSWSEYFQGEWGEPVSSGFIEPTPRKLHGDFDARKEFIHATVESDGSVKIHLSGSINKAFRVVSKNSAPTLVDGTFAKLTPYFTPRGRGAGQWEYPSGGLSVMYVEKITTTDGETEEFCSEPKMILRKGDEFKLVTRAGPLSGVPDEIASLVSPFFYSDERHTFFVEPTLIERTKIQESDRRILDYSVVDKLYDGPEYWDEVDITPTIPGPGPVEQLSDSALFNVQPSPDPVILPGNAVEFGDGLIGPRGGLPAGSVAFEDRMGARINLRGGI
jgi:hypothetical protein